MWCAHCQADVATEVAAEGKSLICTTCQHEVRKVYAPSLHTDTRSARELLDRWSQSELLDKFPSTSKQPAAPVEDKETIEPAPPRTSSSNVNTQHNTVSSVVANSTASSPTPVAPTSRLSSAASRLRLATRPPMVTRPKMIIPTLDADPDLALKDVERSLPPVTVDESKLLNSATGRPEIGEDEASEIQAGEQGERTGVASRPETENVASKSNLWRRDSKPISSVSLARTQTPEFRRPLSPPSVPVSVRRLREITETATEVDSPPDDFEEWNPMDNAPLPYGPTPGRAESLWGQILAYIGVGLLTVGTVLVLRAYLGGHMDLAPTGWLMSTAGQMLLFLGVITLVSGGMQQTTHEVKSHVQLLNNRMIRIEAATQNFLKGPHFLRTRGTRASEDSEEETSLERAG